MSVILQAPVPSLTTTTILPNPKFGDSEKPSHSIDVKQSMNSTLYSYVKSNDRSKLQYTFVLSRMKSLELRAFILSYYRALIRLTNHKGEVWDVYFTSNPFELGSGVGASEPGGTSVTITLELEGKLISPVASPSC